MRVIYCIHNVGCSFSDCRGVYGRSSRAVITKANEQEAVCTDAYANVDHRGGGARVAFSTLEGRPSALNYDNSPVLQDWITATNIKIILTRPGLVLSAGQGIETMLRAAGTTKENYEYYGLSDLSVGGRCKCNGHAARCTTDGAGKQQCECRHNTAGTDCERCKPFHYDRPWASASTSIVHWISRQGD